MIPRRQRIDDSGALTGWDVLQLVGRRELLRARRQERRRRIARELATWGAVLLALAWAGLAGWAR